MHIVQLLHVGQGGKPGQCVGRDRDSLSFPPLLIHPPYSEGTRCSGSLPSLPSSTTLLSSCLPFLPKFTDCTFAHLCLICFCMFLHFSLQFSILIRDVIIYVCLFIKCESNAFFYPKDPNTANEIFRLRSVDLT